jgi:hypothetical protein
MGTSKLPLMDLLERFQDASSNHNAEQQQNHEDGRTRQAISNGILVAVVDLGIPPGKVARRTVLPRSRSSSSLRIVCGQCHSGRHQIDLCLWRLYQSSTVSG